MVFIPNTVGREELLQRPTAESTRMGVHLDLHEILHYLVRRKLTRHDVVPLHHQLVRGSANRRLPGVSKIVYTVYCATIRTA